MLPSSSLFSCPGLQDRRTRWIRQTYPAFLADGIMTRITHVFLFSMFHTNSTEVRRSSTGVVSNEIPRPRHEQQTRNEMEEETDLIPTLDIMLKYP